MESLYYAIERRADGWHARPLDPADPVDDDLRFATRDEALAWCHARGVIVREHEPIQAYGVDLDEMY